MTRGRAAAALGAWLIAACSLLRPLDDLESSTSSLGVELCPEDMQRVAFDDGATFCIDRRETTRAEYDELLEAEVSETLPELQNAALCAADESLEPSGGADCLSAYERGVDPELPVSCVDLCDAMAYCSFRGKRLCGGRGGATLDEDSVNDAKNDEWFAACTGGTGRLYPYSSRFEPGLCNINSAGLEPVNASGGCETPDRIQQLSGNVAEWVLVCKEYPRRNTECLVRGGEYLTTEPGFAGCHKNPVGDKMIDAPLKRVPTDRGPGVGIRCCSD